RGGERSGLAVRVAGNFYPPAADYGMAFAPPTPRSIRVKRLNLFRLPTSNVSALALYSPKLLIATDCLFWTLFSACVGSLLCLAVPSLEEKSMKNRGFRFMLTAVAAVLATAGYATHA